MQVCRSLTGRRCDGYLYNHAAAAGQGSWIVPAGVIFYYPGVRSITLASAGTSLQRAT